MKETYRLFRRNRVAPPVRTRMGAALAVARLAVTGGILVPLSGPPTRPNTGTSGLALSLRR